MKHKIVNTKIYNLIINDVNGCVKSSSGKSNMYKYNTTCICGYKRILLRNQIISNKNSYCPHCNPKKKGNQHPEWEGVGEISKHHFNTIRNSAKVKNYEFRITQQYIWDLFLKQNRKCALTGDNLHFESTYKDRTKTTASLDRIDSNCGYTPDNVQWVTKEVNYLKCNMNNQHFIDICKRIAMHNSQSCS